MEPDLKFEAEKALSAYLTSVLRELPISKRIVGVTAVVRQHCVGIDVQIAAVLTEDHNPRL